MKVTVTTRHIKNSRESEKIKQHALKKSKRIERYVQEEKDPSVRFILSSEKFRDTAEITISSGNIKATSSVETNDMLTAIDNAVDAIVKQLKKQTEKKIKEKRRTGAKTKEEAIETGFLPLPDGSGEPQDLQVHQLPPKPMSIEEASLQLNVSDANFVAFTNSETGQMNVMYYSRRGQRILIEP